MEFMRNNNMEVDRNCILILQENKSKFQDIHTVKGVLKRSGNLNFNIAYDYINENPEICLVILISINIYWG